MNGCGKFLKYETTQFFFPRELSIQATCGGFFGFVFIFEIVKGDSTEFSRLKVYTSYVPDVKTSPNKRKLISEILL